MKDKKDYRYPAMTVSVSEKDMEMIKELREKHFVNISAFFREKVKEMYDSYRAKK